MKFKLKNFLNSYIYIVSLNKINKKINLKYIIKNLYNKYYIIDIINVCKNLCKLYLICYYSSLYNNKILFLNSNKNIEFILKEISNLTGSFILIRNKYIKLLNNKNILKNNLFLYYWFKYIYKNISISKINYNLNKQFNKKFIKLHEYFNILNLLKNNFIIITIDYSLNFKKYSMNNNYIININNNTKNNNNFLNININNNINSYFYILKLITIGILKSKFNKIIYLNKI